MLLDREGEMKVRGVSSRYFLYKLLISRTSVLVNETVLIFVRMIFRQASNICKVCMTDEYTDNS